jgi:predicted RNase H-like HicB family nuclease
MRMQMSDYLSRPYHIVLVPDESEDGYVGWVASVSELPGCLAQGKTAGEALEHIEEAKLEWIAAQLADGKPVPEASPDPSGSGKVLIRMPASLHDRMAWEAERQGVSLNQLCVALLSGGVGWQLAASLTQAASDVGGQREAETGLIQSHPAARFGATLDEVDEVHQARTWETVFWQMVRENPAAQRGLALMLDRHGAGFQRIEDWSFTGRPRIR